MPLVSVVIPTYNCAPYLRESLDSILEGRFRDLEVIVVDDGSTDATADVLATYGDRIRVTAGRHEGLSAARNLGLAEARGTWIAFHDADDVAVPDRLSFAVEFLEQHPEWDAVFSNGERMDDPGKRVVSAVVVQRSVGHPLDARDLFEGFPVYFQGALVPRALFEACGAFDPTFRVQPDIEYGYRLFSRCRAVFIDRIAFRYRWHTTNNSGDRPGGREDVARILDRLETRVPSAATLIGRRRLQGRLARHCYRIARQRAARGDLAGSRAALARALALRPFHPRYRLQQLFPSS